MCTFLKKFDRAWKAFWVTFRQDSTLPLVGDQTDQNEVRADQLHQLGLHPEFDPATQQQLADIIGCWPRSYLDGLSDQEVADLLGYPPLSGETWAQHLDANYDEVLSWPNPTIKFRFVT